MLRRLWSTRPISIDLGLLLMRGSLAVMMMTHGWDKLHTFTDGAVDFPDPLGVSSPVSLSLTIFAEFFCSGFLLMGLFSRIVLIPLTIDMLVVVLVIHGSDPFGDREHALLYLVPYIFLLLSGPGRYSIDHLLKR